MSALLIAIAILMFANIACLLAWFYERDLRAEAESYGWADWDDLAPESETPIFDALAVEHFRQQLADDDLIRRAEQWGDAS